MTDADCMHAKRVCQSFKTKGVYDDFYLKSDTLLKTDVFENFRAMCLKNYHLDSAKQFSSPGLAWQAVLEKLE